jgi:hypothetical protein
MTYPNYPAPGQQPAYPPQQQPQYPPQSYPPAPAYPPAQQPYYQPQQQFAPPPPASQSNLGIDDFYDQPAASGKSIASWFQTPGQSITGVIARAISKADIRPQTDMQTKQPRYFNDGRPMTTMTIPLLVQPWPAIPARRAAVKGTPPDRPDLEAAMEAAGCKPRTVPEAGAVITITFTGLKQIPGFGVPKKVKAITYQRPPGANGQPANPTTQTPSATAPAPGTAPATSANPATAASQYQQQPYNGTYAQQPDPAYGTYAPQGTVPNGPYGQPNADWNPAAQQPPFQPPFIPPTPAPTAAPPATPSAAAPPAGAPSVSDPAQQYAVPGSLTPEQEARLRQLTGQ